MSSEDSAQIKEMMGELKALVVMFNAFKKETSDNFSDIKTKMSNLESDLGRKISNVEFDLGRMKVELSGISKAREIGITSQWPASPFAEPRILLNSVSHPAWVNRTQSRYFPDE